MHRSEPHPLLTFVIPTYNRAHTLDRAITSVIEAFGDHGVAEIVVVDDGSTDGTADVLQRYAATYCVRTIVFPNNRGLASARNTAIEAARGMWIALLDSDNALLPSVGPALVSHLSNLTDDVGVFWGGSIDSTHQPLVHHNLVGVIKGKTIVESGISGEHFSVVRRSLMLETPYPTSAGSHACEAAFWAQTSQRTNFFITLEPFQRYDTTGTDRICAAENRIARANDFATCFELTAAHLVSFAPTKAARARSRSALYRCVGGAWGTGIRLAWQALRTGPITKDGIGILTLCLAGPTVAKTVIRRRNQS